jgi:hypothetical protein
LYGTTSLLALSLHALLPSIASRPTGCLFDIIVVAAVFVYVLCRRPCPFALVAATRTARLSRTSSGLAFVLVRRPHRQPSIAPALVGAHGLDLAAAQVALSTTCFFKLLFRVLLFLLAPAEWPSLAPVL